MNTLCQIGYTTGKDDLLFKCDPCYILALSQACRWVKGCGEWPETSSYNRKATVSTATSPESRAGEWLQAAFPAPVIASKSKEASISTISWRQGSLKNKKDSLIWKSCLLNWALPSCPTWTLLTSAWLRVCGRTSPMMNFSGKGKLTSL